MGNENDFYSNVGVSSKKEDVHSAIKDLEKGLYPGAFCKILPDYLTGDPDYCLIMHADGTGTKSSLAYAYWKETGDLSAMRNIPIDAIVMNLDDVICVGACGPFIIDQTINRNKFNLPAEPLREIIRGTEAYLEKMRSLGVEINHGGGETADVGDVVKTFIIDNSIVTRMKRTDVIDCSHISGGEIIVGLASAGLPATYEDEYNSGIGSNGLTAGRHSLFAHYLADKYPELYDEKNLAPEDIFCGNWKLEDVPKNAKMSVGKMALSPTRTYAPIIIDFLKKVDRSSVSGIIHCSGGGQTKCLSVIQRSVHVIKDNLFPVPRIFKLLYETGKMNEREMYKNFNMGHRMEVYCNDKETAQVLLDSANKFGVIGRVIGKCEKSSEAKLTITSWLGNKLEYVY